MKNFIVAFSVFMMWAILGMWYYSCFVKEVCDDDVLTDQQTTENRSTISENVEEEDTISPEERRLANFVTTDSLVVVNSDYETIFSYPLAPKIKINSPEVSIPQTTSIFISDVTKHLNENPDAHLIIYGAYDQHEFNSSEENNHGTTRAAHVRDLLVEEGINAGRISIESIIADLKFIQDEIFEGGILLQLKNYDELEEDEMATVDDDRFNRTIHTNFDETFRPNQEIRDYATRLKEFLDDNPGKRLTITGHTDNVGEAQDNEWIGMERAKAVRDFLKSQGIEEFKMQTISKGETEPIVDNTTRENRAKNRRIEITVN